MLEQVQAEVREAEVQQAGALSPSADEPNDDSFLTVNATTEMCNDFEEVIKGQSNR